MGFLVQKTSHFSPIWCVDSEVIALWWVPCRVRENGKSCRKLKVRWQKVFLVAKGFNCTERCEVWIHVLLVFLLSSVCNCPLSHPCEASFAFRDASNESRAFSPTSRWVDISASTNWSVDSDCSWFIFRIPEVSINSKSSISLKQLVNRGTRLVLFRFKFLRGHSCVSAYFNRFLLDSNERAQVQTDHVCYSVAMGSCEKVGKSWLFGFSFGRNVASFLGRRASGSWL